MANNSALKQDIRDYIYTNHNEEITGNILRDVLLEMVDTLGDGWTYKGVATTTTNPGTPDDNVFYIATAPGTYTNFGGLSVADGEVAILKYNGTWAKDVTGAATKAQLDQLGQEIDDIPANYVLGKYLNTSGAEVEDDGYFISCKIPAVLGDSLTFSGTAKYMCTYTSEDVFCDFWGSRTTLTISGSANTNAAYIIVSFDISNLQTAYVTKNYVMVWKPKNAPGLKSDVSKLEQTFKEYQGINLYDESTGMLFDDTYRYNQAKLSGDEGYIVISAKQSVISSSYVTNVKFIFADGTFQNADTPTFVSGVRYGLKYTVPSGAKAVSFYYRASYSGGVLLSDIMVTAGASVPSVYEPYSVTIGFKNPNFEETKKALFKPVFVATNGDDSNNGEIGTPFASIQRALAEGRPIIVKGGTYTMASSLDVSVCDADTIKISSYPGERVNLIRGRKVATQDGELVSGYTKVYAVSVSSSYDYSHKWLYQFGVADTTTEIPNSERTAIHKRKKYRCDFTAIMKVASIEEVENADGYAFYYSSGTLYLSRPVSISEEKFIFESRDVLFKTTSISGRKLEIDGLLVYGATFNITETVDSIYKNCSAYGCYAGAGWQLDRCRNALLENCEAARVEMLGSSPLGDGFNAHTDGDSDDKALSTNFEMRNCWSHDNNNDGYSDHEGCEGYINGGLFEHNCIAGQGAGITPAYGAHDIIKNAICQNNNNQGFLYTGNGTSVQYQTGDNGSVQLVSVVSRNNAASGFVFGDIKQFGDFINCIAYGNTSHGFRAVSGAFMRCINTLSVNNGGDAYSGDGIERVYE